jgi:hypothetical protein
LCHKLWPKNYKHTKFFEIFVYFNFKYTINKIKDNDVNYFLSVVDLWLLFKHIGLSAVFISSFNIKIMDEGNKHSFTANMVDDNIAFIVVPGLGENKIPNFKYISNGNLVNKDDLLCEIKDPINFTDFLINYKIETKTEYKKQKPKFTIIDDIQSRPKPKFTIIDEPSKPKPKFTIVDL